ncbi:glycosyltransferase family 2 protein [Diaphorobacter sp. HDW4B]|uniref:glycosyltransferase family 2 protein n=1 Tax=Diaphorobacter sp. HDW4B TaxID=2714925 RepID=UPI0014074765|nr:glycosyltransferase family 2 protein [Diaphorobacter sp. HDW4B]QIL69323.1 glycosyltransferase family 2 protein [Diaphorobacter sp. HDW4B]
MAQQSHPTTHSIVTIIPVYNHPDTMDDMLRGVLASGMDCIMVDDGSDANCARVLDELAVKYAPRAELLRLLVNEGKGGAMIAGMRHAQKRGFTHAVQIDADGQHATADIPAFAESSRKHPNAMICGTPVYDESVPKARFYGRYATHVWVWINTLSLDIRDSMCGFRVYPLADALRAVDSAHIGKRMEFDPEILVRMHWHGVPFVNQFTRVTYPQDGLSHFRVLRDNVLISKMHARLFAGMLLRSPVLLARKLTGCKRSGALT